MGSRAVACPTRSAEKKGEEKGGGRRSGTHDQVLNSNRIFPFKSPTGALYPLSKTGGLGRVPVMAWHWGSSGRTVARGCQRTWELRRPRERVEVVVEVSLWVKVGKPGRLGVVVVVDEERGTEGEEGSIGGGESTVVAIFASSGGTMFERASLLGEGDCGASASAKVDVGREVVVPLRLLLKARRPKRPSGPFRPSFRSLLRRPFPVFVGVQHH